MGSCLSKKKDSSSSSSSVTDSTVPVPAPAPVKASTVTVDPKKCDNTQTQKELPKQETKEEVKEEEGLVKKEIFVIKHRNSHDKRAVNEEIVVNAAETEKEKDEIGSSISNGVVRTSSCTKEEVDAILIQCGRLSRSNSSGKTASSARKYSGSKRSYDFDQNEGGFERDGGDDSGDVVKKKGSDEEEQIQRQHRQRHRQSSRQSPNARRRTPSRERDQQRSGSRERGSSSGSGRRVSRSPGRRSENNSASANANASATANRPGKMVSVPATVAVEPATASNSTGVKRISVKRNVGEAAGAVGSRTAASPRSKSPARVNGNNVKEQQHPSLSRNSSRKAEQHSPYRRNPSSEIDHPNSTRKAENSPYRRNPLSEIDPNSLQYPQSACNNKASNVITNRVRNKSRDFEGEGVFVKDSSVSVLCQAPIHKPNAENIAQGTNNHKSSCRATALNNKVTGANITEKEHRQILEEDKAQLLMTGNAAVVSESQKPQTLTRSRSSRRSRDLDLDLDPETSLNPTPSYTALLLEDIQNFHQKSTPSVSLPACVTKACSILEAVADLNSTTSSSLSCAFSEDRKTPSADQSNNKNAYKFSAGVNLVGKKMTEAKDPFVESEVLADDDLMEPSFHRYVTVRRGGSELGGVDMDGQESSGSNSFVGCTTQQNWTSSSSWEPNSADSTDRWTSRSNMKEEDQSPLGFQRHASSEGCEATKNRKGFSGKRRETDYQPNGNWRGRVAVATAAASS